MSSSSACKRAGYLIGAAALLCGPGSAARADDKAFLAQGAYFALTAENTASDLELGISFAPSDELRVRPYARVPFSDTDRQLVRVDGHSRAAKVGLGLDYGTDWTAASGPARFLVASAQVELGTDVYRFEPTSSMSSSERHQSFSGRVQARYGVLWTTLQIAPQVSVAYDRNYAGADAVGIVSPGMAGSPDTVQTVVVDPPSTTPAITLRLGTPWYYGKLHAPIAFGTYVVAAVSGATDDYKAWGEGETVRGELWTYLFVNKPTNARAGLALFAESSRATASANAVMSYGLFVQLKANTTLLEY